MQFLSSLIFLVPFWFLMSGKFDLFHIALGVISILIVGLWSGKLFIQSPDLGVIPRLKQLGKFIPYFFWLLIEIVKSNIHVIRISLSPNISEKINPQLISFKTKLNNDFSKFILANSITLTPGTVTVRISKNEFLVHAIDDTVAAGTPGDMEKKIAHVFDEDIK